VGRRGRRLLSPTRRCQVLAGLAPPTSRPCWACSTPGSPPTCGMVWWPWRARS